MLTLLNVRLGYWAPTPNKTGWQRAAASLWPVYAFRELTSQTNELSTFCYLTDGGHFDNTGLYSLIERGCRNIVLVDCGADPKPCFEDLGTVIRRCRIDFGTEIALDLEPAMAAGADGRHWLKGTISYAAGHADVLRLDPADREGVLLVIKPRVLHAGETPDGRQYQFENSNFPQQTTSDQWFDEAQFESYRKLGQISAQSVIDAGGGTPALAPFQQQTFSPDATNAFFDTARNSSK